jgi:hypothetical protein
MRDGYRTSDKIEALIKSHTEALYATIPPTALYDDTIGLVLRALVDSADSTYDEDGEGWIEAYQLGLEHRAVRQQIWCVHSLDRDGTQVLFWYGSEKRVLARIRAALARGLAAVDAGV